MFKFITNIFKKPFVTTSEVVKFSRTEAVDSDVAELVITVHTTKRMASLIENTLKVKAYEILAADAVEKSNSEPKADTVFQLPSNMVHTPVAGKVRQFN